MARYGQAMKDRVLGRLLPFRMCSMPPGSSKNRSRSWLRLACTIYPYPFCLSARYITRISGLASLPELAPAALSKAVQPMLLGTTDHEGSRAR